MKTIYKYPLIIDDYQTLEMPQGAEILTIQIQKRIPCIWALVNPKQPKQKRHIRIAGTGHSVNDKVIEYIGTYQLYGGDIIFHVFEIDKGEG